MCFCSFLVLLSQFDCGICRWTFTACDIQNVNELFVNIFFIRSEHWDCNRWIVLLNFQILNCIDGVHSNCCCVQLNYIFFLSNWCLFDVNNHIISSVSLKILYTLLFEIEKCTENQLQRHQIAKLTGVPVLAEFNIFCFIRAIKVKTCDCVWNTTCSDNTTT